MEKQQIYCWIYFFEACFQRTDIHSSLPSGVVRPYITTVCMSVPARSQILKFCILQEIPNILLAHASLQQFFIQTALGRQIYSFENRWHRKLRLPVYDLSLQCKYVAKTTRIVHLILSTVDITKTHKTPLPLKYQSYLEATCL